MFTGIVQKLAPVLESQPGTQSLKIRVATGFEDLAIGESVSVNGVCLTVTEISGSGVADFFLSQETLDRTNLGQATHVNLERALLPTTRISGHWVQGHVDGLASLLEVNPRGEGFELAFRLPRALGRYCVEKGSITLNGVSLTLNSIEDRDYTQTVIRIMVIPHTWSHTNLSALAVGAPVNLEVDILAKYVERLCHP